MKTKYDRAGSEAKLYLFNDAIMITRKQKVGGARVCKEFATLANVELIGADGGMAIFGLNILEGKGGKQKCHVFKGSSTADSTASFIAALQNEMAMLQMRRRSEVLLPGAGLAAFAQNAIDL